MIHFLLFLLAVSQPASTTGSSPEGYISDDSSDVSIENELCLFNSDTLMSLPVSDIIDLVKREPGILNSGLRCGSIKFFSGGTRSIYYSKLSTLNAGIESNLHMRGGRSDEVAYLVDGFILRNPLTGGFISSIPLSSIREASAVRGNFDVRYGNAQSGIVEIETFEGGSSYHGGISISGNDWQALGLADDWTWGGTSPDDPTVWKWSNVSSSSEARLEFGARIGGPEPITSYLLPEIGIQIPGELRIFADGEFLQTGGGEDGRYGYGFDEWESTYKGIIKLTYNPSASTEIDLSTSFLNRASGWFGVGDYWAWCRYEVPYIDIDPLSPAFGDTLAWGRNILYGLPTRFWNNSSIGLRISHEVSEETSIQLGIGQYRTSFDFKIRNDPASLDPMRQTEWLGEGWSLNDWQQYETDLYTDADGFRRSGTSRFPWSESSSTTTTAQADVTTRIGREHELSAGIDGSYYDIFSFDVIGDSGSVNLNRYSAFPNSGGVYLQDRIELDDGFVMNAGVRLDYFDANYDRADGPLDIPPPPSFQRDVLNLIEAPVKYSINPRLSFLCPVTDRDFLHFTYGVHSQIPALRQMYRQADYSFSEDTPLGGNPDLDFERTVQYEIGITHKISDMCMIDMTGYVKNFSNMIETDVYSLSPIGDYALYTNGGYGESKGLEITFNGNPDGFFSWNVSYILSRSTGTSSHALQNYLYSLYYGFSNADTDQYLDWDQRHTVYADLDLYVPRGRGFRIAGVPVFQGLGVHLAWDFGSGFPYTNSNQGTYEPQVNTARYPATCTVALKINKAIWFSDMTLNAWCEVTNLFSKQNINNIEDIDWYTDWGHDDCGDPDYDPKGQLDNYYAYSQPRMIRFGLGLNW
ncbi:MAG: TonB-dependent receptor [Candidatus Aegiribacteria sp.]|nr:TonB-dependent receptor [Candidatus Aegiribacteria sp.]